jgi:hypothetical protein
MCILVSLSEFYKENILGLAFRERFWCYFINFWSTHGFKSSSVLQPLNPGIKFLSALQLRCSTSTESKEGTLPPV